VSLENLFEDGICALINNPDVLVVS